MTNKSDFKKFLEGEISISDLDNLEKVIQEEKFWLIKKEDEGTTLHSLSQKAETFFGNSFLVSDKKYDKGSHTFLIKEKGNKKHIKGSIVISFISQFKGKVTFRFTVISY